MQWPYACVVMVPSLLMQQLSGVDISWLKIIIKFTFYINLSLFCNFGRLCNGSFVGFCLNLFYRSSNPLCISSGSIISGGWRDDVVDFLFLSFMV